MMKLRMKVSEALDDFADVLEEKGDKIRSTITIGVLVAIFTTAVYRKGYKDAGRALAMQLASRDPETLVNIYKAFSTKK